jgi:hypothetical protein
VTALEVVQETLEFYKDHPERTAISEDGEYRYRTDDGRKCPLGRYLVSYEPEMEGQTARRLFQSYGRKVLDPKVGHLPCTLFSQLQRWHDRPAQRPELEPLLLELAGEIDRELKLKEATTP